MKELNWNELKTDYEVIDYSLNSQEELIKTGDILSIKLAANQNATAAINYSIQLLGDYNNDGLVDEKDSEYIIDEILNNNTEQNFNILDATNPVFKTGLWENNATAKDVIELTDYIKEKIEEILAKKLYVKDVSMDDIFDSYYLNYVDLNSEKCKFVLIEPIISEELKMYYNANNPTKIIKCSSDITGIDVLSMLNYNANIFNYLPFTYNFCGGFFIFNIAIPFLVALPCITRPTYFIMSGFIYRAGL